MDALAGFCNFMGSFALALNQEQQMVEEIAAAITIILTPTFRSLRKAYIDISVISNIQVISQP
jgi:hypothetical protein